MSWVRNLYEREARDHNGGVPGDEKVPLDELFDPSTQKLREAAAAGPGPKLDGPILHVLFGSGVLPKRHVEITSVRAGERLRQISSVVVDLTVNTHPLSVTVLLTRQCGDARADRWCIFDLNYSSGQSFRAHLSELARR